MVPNDYSYWNEDYGKTGEQFPEGLEKWSVSVGSVVGSYAIDRCMICATWTFSPAWLFVPKS